MGIIAGAYLYRARKKKIKCKAWHMCTEGVRFLVAYSRV